MSLLFTDAVMNSRGLPEPYDAVLGVEATLQLTSGDGRLVYEEPFFPVVELALALEDWLKSGLGAGKDFSFDSVESDESGLLSCRPHGCGWRIGALEQEFADMTVYGTARVAEVFSAFVRDVDGWLMASTGRSLYSTRLSGFS
ncbi:MAG: hypothetical protein ACRCYX_12225 [Dermatophilaceae bacterium]